MGYLRARDGDVVSEKFDADLVILDLKSGKYFSLSSGAAAVWQALTGGQSVEEVAAGSHADVSPVVRVFLENALLVEAEPPEAPASPTVIDQSMSMEVQVFDDLADLLIADPIHEVDEQAGWPHRPPAQD